MAHGDAREGKLANWVGSQSPSHRFTVPRNLMYPALLSMMRTRRLPAVDWTDAPADLNGLVRFAERRNLVSARVPSHFKRPLPPGFTSSNATSYSQNVLMGFVQLPQRYEITCLYRVKPVGLVVVNVYCAVRTDSVNIFKLIFSRT